MGPGAGGWGPDNPNKIKTVTKYFKQFYDVFIIKKLFIKKLFVNEVHIIKHHRWDYCGKCEFPRDASGLRLATLFKKRLWHRCFPVNFVKFLRTPFYEHLWWLLFPRLSLYILLLPCCTTLEILLLSQKAVFLLYAERRSLY